MKTQHTPGPWREQGNGTLLHPQSHRPLTTVRIETSLGSFEILDETNEPDANARLIAAAPTMYDYLTLLASGGDDKAHEIISQISRP